MTIIDEATTLENSIADAKVRLLDAGQCVEECWRRYGRSCTTDSQQRTDDYSDARLSDQAYREAYNDLQVLLRTDDQERVNARLIEAIT